MRTSLKFAAGICALAGAVSYSAMANAAYYNRYSDGSWTNAEYNDGNCHYYYSHNGYDGETHVNRYTDGNWTNAHYDGGGCQYFYSVNNATGESHVNRYGNCSHVAIGADGRPLPVVPMAQVVRPMQPPY
jgi:hypothetical protein